MRRPTLSLLAMSFVAVACSASPTELAVAETADRLRGVESGTIGLSITARPESSKKPVGFSVAGPFSFSQGTSLPVADLEYTELAGPERATYEFVSTGEEAFVEVDGTAYRLEEDQVASMRLGEAEPVETMGLEHLRLDRWLRNAEFTSSGGVSTVIGQLDVIEVINDMIALSAEFGAELLPGVDRLEGKDAEQLERSVRSSAFELVTGTEDHMLRRLVMEVTFGTPDDENLPQAIRELEGTVVRMELTLADANQPVEVEAPAISRPYSELTAAPTG